MSSPSRRSTIRFAAFEVDRETGELKKHGLRIRLQEQPFKILMALLEKPGEVVSREELRERIWGNDAFVDFDHGLSAAVNRLRESLGDKAEEPKYVETMARRGYRFIGQVEGAPEPVAVKAVPARRPYWKCAWAAVGLLVVGGAGIWMAGKRTPLPAPRVVPLTTLSGNEGTPAFSPDGKQVAFFWRGEKQDNADIYVKVVGDTAVLRLTSDPAVDTLPAWSPDGRQIAFFSTRGEGGIYVISAVGGPERKVADLKTAGRMAWSADSKWLLVGAFRQDDDPSPEAGALFSVAADGSSAPRRVLTPPRGAWYINPALSPDGRVLAFQANAGMSSSPYCTIQVVKTGEGWRMDGSPQPVTPVVPVCAGLTWAADGASLIYSGGVAGVGMNALWRVRAQDRTKPERLDLAWTGAFYPAVDSRNGRLAFDAQREDGGWDIWRIDEAGGSPRRLTNGPGENAMPSWSRDGNWIYFHSNRTGHSEIWRVPANEGNAEQVTRKGGYKPEESADGKALYYTMSVAGTEGVYGKKLPDGQEEQVVNEGVLARGFCVFSDGIYYLDRSAGRKVEIRFYEFATRRIRTVAELDGLFHYGLSVSADRKTFLFSNRVDAGSDLMLIENFR